MKCRINKETGMLIVNPDNEKEILELETWVVENNNMFANYGIEVDFRKQLNQYKMTDKIIAILKEFEQRDYKRGGVSIPPEVYNAIANKINILIQKGN